MTDAEAPALGPGREFDLIRALVRGWGARAAGIGDDCAVLDVPPGERLVATTDASVEGVHLRRDWCTPEEIGYRATTAAISDLAAMAALPGGLLVSLVLPDEWRRDAEALARGIGEAAAAAGTVIVGGDVSTGAALVLSITALGHTVAPLRRSGATPGQGVWVTGRLGGPGAAVRAWLAGGAPTDADRRRFVRPEARIRQARWLAAHGATAAIDISDGLLGDLEHVAHASGVSLRVALDELPVVAGVTPEQGARSGEEYELAVCAPAGLPAEAFAAEFGLELTKVGAVEAGGPGVVATLRGARVAPGGGWDHFS